MRRSGVRIPLAPPQADIRCGCRFFVCLAWCCGACCCGALSPLVFRAPSGPAAREIATREPEGSEWSISKPARALRTLRRPPHRRRLVADVWLGASARSPARPRHRPRAQQPVLHIPRALVSLRSVACRHRTPGPCRRLRRVLLRRCLTSRLGPSLAANCCAMTAPLNA